MEIEGRRLVKAHQEDERLRLVAKVRLRESVEVLTHTRAVGGRLGGGLGDEDGPAELHERCARAVKGGAHWGEDDDFCPFVMCVDGIDGVAQRLLARGRVGERVEQLRPSCVRRRVKRRRERAPVLLSLRDQLLIVRLGRKLACDSHLAPLDMAELGVDAVALDCTLDVRLRGARALLEIK